MVVSVAATGILVVAMLTWEDAPFAFTFDDAYYYFGIARNMANGAGSTFDGINPTNGYHPLWLLVSTLAFRAGLDDLDAARGLLALQLVVGWGAALLCVARILTESIDRWEGVSRREAQDRDRAHRSATVVLVVVFALVAVNPFIVKVFVNGLETGISVSLLALFLLIGSRTPTWLSGTSAGRRVGVGALLALLFLARTDSVLVIGCLGLWCVAEWWHRRARTDLTPVLAVGRMAQLFALPVLTIVGYLVANDRWFGSPFQVSGLVKRAELNPTTMGLFAIFVAAAAFAGFRGFRSSHRPRSRRVLRFPHTVAFAARTAWYGAACVLVVGYYTVLQTQIWLWYFAPLVLYGIVLLLLAVTDIVESALRGGRPETSPARLLAPAAAIFVIPLLVALVFEVREFTNPTLLSIQQADRDTGRWLRSNIDEDAVVASWDAGAIGYFSHRHVVNLDGLVNSHAYYEAMQQRTRARFLRCEGVTYVANHGDPANGDDPAFRDLIGAMYGADAARDATIVYRQPFLYSGTTTGSAGTESGLREQMSYVYRVADGAAAEGDPRTQRPDC